MRTATPRRKKEPVEPVTVVPKSPEQEVIGSVLINPACMAKVSQILTAADFLDEYNAEAFRILHRMFVRRTPIDAVTFKGELAASELFASGQVSVMAYLAECGKSVGNVAHVGYYCGLVREAACKVRLADLGNTIRLHAMNGHASTEIVAELLAEAEDIRRNAAGDDDVLNHLHDATQRLSDGTETPYLVPGVLPCREFGVIAAKSKSLKTKTALDMAIGVATATDFLGHWHIPTPRRIYFLSREIVGNVLDGWVEDICQAKGVSRLDLGNLILDDRSNLDLTTERGLSTLRKIVEKFGVEAMILDPVNFLLPGVNMNDLPEMTLHLNRVKQVSDDTGVTIDLVHHNRKNARDVREQFAPPTLEDIHGSGFSQVARHWILLNRRRDWDAENRRHHLHLVVGGSAGHAAHKWYDAEEGQPGSLAGTFWKTAIATPSEGAEAARQAKEDAKAREDAEKWERRLQACCNVLAASDKPLSKSAMLKAAKVNVRDWDSAVEMLIDEGHVVQDGKKFLLAS